jgi:prepilin-type N-terminal cleavage/methylation domain-containing protein
MKGTKILKPKTCHPAWPAGRLTPRNGFTLLELLVVLAIIAILIAIGVAAFSAAQLRARDAQRKSDLKTIASALENYYAVNKLYPKSSLGTCSGTSFPPTLSRWFCSNDSINNSWDTLKSALLPFIKVLPKDPKDAGDPTKICDTAFAYAYHSATDSGVNEGEQFILVAKLENVNDKEISNFVRYGNTNHQFIGCFAIASP